MAHSLLATTDWTNAPEVAFDNVILASSIDSVVYGALSTVEKREDASKLLAMIGVRHKLFENETIRVALPYRIDIVRGSTLPQLNNRALRENLSSLFNTTLPEDWLKRLEEEEEGHSAPVVELEPLDLDAIDFDD